MENQTQQVDSKLFKRTILEIETINADLVSTAMNNRPKCYYPR